MDEHFGVAINPLIELVISDFGLLDAYLVRHDKTWLRLAGDDQVTEIAIVSLDIALTGAKGETLRGNNVSCPDTSR
jgi:hypothetical protein